MVQRKEERFTFLQMVRQMEFTLSRGFWSMYPLCVHSLTLWKYKNIKALQSDLAFYESNFFPMKKLKVLTNNNAIFGLFYWNFCIYGLSLEETVLCSHISGHPKTSHLIGIFLRFWLGHNKIFDTMHMITPTGKAAGILAASNMH